VFGSASEQNSLGGSERAAAQTKVAIDRLNAVYASGTAGQTRYSRGNFSNIHGAGIGRFVRLWSPAKGRGGHCTMTAADTRY
jgi:hypothetical protein